MTTDELHYLVTIARHRNIGRAAEALGLTQPALTRAIARMEAVAGQRLFARHPRGVEPTPAGQVFVQRAQEMLTAYEDALRELHQMKAGQLGLLRVGYSPSIDEDVLVSAARQLLVERPAAQLRLVERLSVLLMQQLAAGDLDLVIGPVPTPLPSDFEADPLYESRMHVVADAAHPLQRIGPLTLAQVVAEPWLLSAPPTPLRREIDDMLAAADLPPLTVRVEADSLSHTQFKILRGTRMLGLCSDWWLPIVGPMGLRRLEVPDLHVHRQIAVLRRRGAYQSPLTERLTNLLHEEIARHAPTVSAAAAAAPAAAPASARPRAR